MSTQQPEQISETDVVVVGAGIAGLYLLHRLRSLGLRVRVLEAADGIGGTWNWNRYPGARCDVQSVDYSYSFDPELDAEWRWSEKYATQPEILRYLDHVATRFDLYSGIELSTRVDSAVWDDARQRWQVHTSTGATIDARFYVMATGCLSAPKDVDIDGAADFAGPVYFTSRWPHDGVDFTGRRVAVIGTGSSAIQSIPIIAAQAAQLTVFQRTANFSIPAHNGPTPDEKWNAISADRPAYRQAARWSGAGVPLERSEVSALAVSDEERLETYEQAWADGGIIEFLATYVDHVTSPEANELLSEFVRNKIRGIVDDPVTAEALCPKSFPIGTKRLCVDTGYYETYNLEHVRLVDLRTDPIERVTAAGVAIADEVIEVDDLVYATGFDAMTGALVGVDIRGRGGLALRDAWSAGPTTYLGLMAADFPNLFMVTGPGSPSVLSNMVVSIEQHVDWIVDCIATLRSDGYDVIEPTPAAVEGWVRHVNAFANLTLMPQANSWYMGANVPGKPRVFLPYPGGCDRYRAACDEVAAGDYLGFRRDGAAGEVVHDGIVRPVQPDVMVMLEMMATLGLPALDTMEPEQARMFMAMMSEQSPPGPPVGDVLDGELPGPAGPLSTRTYRPAGAGPHPLVVYFHGGGWVIGNHTTDDAFCRDLCNRLGAVVVSVDYRHAPEHRFPAPVDDAWAAVQWLAKRHDELGTDGRLVVAGWSAGANLATVVTHLARDAGGPSIDAQLLVTPVTDCDETTGSWVDNADGYSLTSSLMRWFWNHYADPDERTDPRASPLRATSLAGLPPAVVVTCQFDPLRDEGVAYAAAMSAAGVDVQHIAASGHIHTSITAVGVLPTGDAVRDELVQALVDRLAPATVG